MTDGKEGLGSGAPLNSWGVEEQRSRRLYKMIVEVVELSDQII